MQSIMINVKNYLNNNRTVATEPIIAVILAACSI